MEEKILINIGQIIRRMDKDCATRTVLSALGGQDNLFKQLHTESQIMQLRVKESGSESEEQPGLEADDSDLQNQFEQLGESEEEEPEK